MQYYDLNGSKIKGVLTNPRIFKNKNSTCEILAHLEAATGSFLCVASKQLMYIMLLVTMKNNEK